MPSYLRPGVFIDESLTPLISPLSVPGVAPSAFVGPAPQGPTVPTQVTSWAQYVALYGSFADGTYYLPFAVYQFFNNGGQTAWIQRVTHSDATSATLTINNRAGTSAPLLKLSADNPGVWGNSVYVDVRDSGATGSGRIDLIVYYGGTTVDKIVERWVDTSMNPTDARYLPNLLNSADTGSYYLSAINLRQLLPLTTTLTASTIVGATALPVTASAGFSIGQSVTLEPNTANSEVVAITAIPDGTNLTVTATTKAHSTGAVVQAGAAYAVTDTPAVTTGTPLTGGADGVAAYNYVTAVTGNLGSLTDNINLNLPGVNDSSTINQIITWLESQQNFFLVVDVPQAVPGASSSTTATAYAALATGGTAFTASSYVGVYGPWLVLDDPASNVPGATRSLPPGGAVLGQFARTDATRGVQKPPAGIQSRISGLIGVETSFGNTDLDTLNSAGINIIRSVPGNGFCIMGARTLLTGMPSRYVSIRRTLMSIKKSITDGTRFAIFEPNTPDLWATISATISQYLTSLMQIGVLKGNTPQEAFYVTCDSTTNPPQKVAAGEVHLQVGVALTTPAEFIVIQIGQFDGSANATDNAS